MRPLLPLFFAMILTARAAAQDSFPPTVGTVIIETPLEPAFEWPKPVRGATGPTFLNSGEVFTAENYPYQAQSRRIEGRVQVMLVISPEGRAVHCHTVGQVPPPELAMGTCMLFTDLARFEPARDRRGRPVSATYRRQIVWVLEPHEPGPVEAGYDRLLYSFTADGMVSDCRFEFSERPDKKVNNRQCPENALFAQMLAAASGRTDWKDWELVLETRAVVGSDQLWRSIGRGPDEMFIDWTNVSLDIGSSGAITRCERSDGGLGEIIKNMALDCTILTQEPFLPAAEAHRKLQIVNVVYARRTRPGLPTT